MDGFTNSKIEKESIYEIYRACRLCGAGAGYKMPIIQNVVDLDSGEVELKQKVRECVQIEVHQDDKMPPLICELCVDKVNDFYEFLEMCRQTNKRTRLRLGLPPQMLPRGAPDAGDCILGVTEPIFIDNEDSNEPILKSKGKTVKPVKVNREPENRDSKPKVAPKKDVKEGGKDRHEPRSLRRGAPSPPPPSPPRLLRGAKRSHEDDNVSLSSLKKSRKSDEPAPTKPRSILKTHRESKSEERAKITRLREKENEKIVNEKANAKKVVKIMVKKENFKAPYRAASPRPPPPEHKCKVCSAIYDTGLALSNHMRAHAKQKPVEQKPSTKRHECRRCCKQFLSRNLMEIHRCSGRPVPVKSNKPVTEVKPEPKPERPISKPKPERPVSKPQRAVTPKVSKPKRAEAPIDPELLKQLRPLQVRISRCDPLLENRLGDHYDASDVDYDYGLDKTCVYPYIYTFRHMRIKSEPLYMVSIQDEFKSALDRRDSYVHWDSDETDSDLDLSDTKNVDTLTSISLKTLFSKKLLGKVPKKRKKVKVEKAFDSILNSTSDFDSDMRLGIDNIISSLGDDNDKSLLDSSGAAKVDKNDDNDSLFGDDNSPAIAVTNDDFDSLFGGGATKTDDTNKITKSDASNINSFSMDFDEFDGKDCKNDSNAVQERKEFNKSDDSLNENDISDAKNVNDDIDSVKTSNTEIDKSDSKEDDTEKSIGDNDTNKNDSKEEDTEKPSDDNDTNKRDNSSTDNKENSDDKNNHTLGVKTSSEGKDDSKTDENPESGELKAGKDKANNDGAHVNGQTDLAQEFNMDDLEDVSESEMEESSLMEALDAQIDEKGTANAKIASERDRTVAEDSVPASGKSADLESISDGEFE